MMSNLMTVRKQSVLDISCDIMKGMKDRTQRQVKKLRNDKHGLAGTKVQKNTGTTEGQTRTGAQETRG